MQTLDAWREYERADRHATVALDFAKHRESKKIPASMRIDGKLIVDDLITLTRRQDPDLSASLSDVDILRLWTTRYRGQLTTLAEVFAPPKPKPTLQPRNIANAESPQSLDIKDVSYFRRYGPGLCFEFLAHIKESGVRGLKKRWISLTDAIAACPTFRSLILEERHGFLIDFERNDHFECYDADQEDDASDSDDDSVRALLVAPSEEKHVSAAKAEFGFVVVPSKAHSSTGIKKAAASRKRAVSSGTRTRPAGVPAPTLGNTRYMIHKMRCSMLTNGSKPTKKKKRTTEWRFDEY